MIINESSEPNSFPGAILFIIFNRADTTRKVFEAIRKVQPERLYIAADGPRRERTGEAERCELTRAIANEVDWQCTVKTLFRTENLGCGIGPVKAIDWFFEQEEEGIILEDDCVPDQSFFWFCHELLEKYRNDSRVMHISGTNLQYGWQREPQDSYYFSGAGISWGWATWRRAWSLYDYHIEDFGEALQKGQLASFFFNRTGTEWVMNHLQKAYQQDAEVDWWDFQWDLIKHLHSGLSIIPNRNLVENIGFGKEATHTFNESSKAVHNRVHSLSFPLQHPRFIILDYLSDERYYQVNFAPSPTKQVILIIKSWFPPALWDRIKTLCFYFIHPAKKSTTL